MKANSNTLWFALALVILGFFINFIAFAGSRRNESEYSTTSTNGLPGATSGDIGTGDSEPITNGGESTGSTGTPPPTPTDYEHEVASYEVTVGASSYLDGDYELSRPTNIFDGDRTTAWQEGAPGNGTGEWIELTFSSEQRFARLELIVGYDKPPTDADDTRPHRWDLNNKMRKARITVGYSQKEVEFDPYQKDFQTVDLSGMSGDRIRIEAIDVLESHYDDSDDLCLSEVKVFTLQSR